jgi:hypothetical protein
MKKSSRKKPELKMAVTAWSLVGHPAPGRSEWSPQQKVRAVKNAGFDAMAARRGTPFLGEAVKLGLAIVGNQDIGSKKEVLPALTDYKKLNATHINIQLCDHDTPTEKALPIAEYVMEVGDRLGLKPAIEVHRDTCTETPEKAYALADAYFKKTRKKLRMNFDHSHPAIIKHLAPNAYWDRLGVRLDLLTMGEFIHFRPFNGHHCQIPITNGKGRLSVEFQQWLPFCDKVIETWIKAAKPGMELMVIPELGPKGGYGLSCFPDIWKDLLVLSKEIRRIWNRHIRNWK